MRQLLQKGGNGTNDERTVHDNTVYGGILVLAVKYELIPGTGISQLRDLAEHERKLKGNTLRKGETTNDSEHKDLGNRCNNKTWYGTDEDLVHEKGSGNHFIAKKELNEKKDYRSRD